MKKEIQLLSKEVIQELTIMLILELNYQHNVKANAFSTLYVAGAIVKE